MDAAKQKIALSYLYVLSKKIIIKNNNEERIKITD
jgi:hypothetical protein